jgi:pimeloyl-ACP methyl ester carboxylesterase
MSESFTFDIDRARFYGETAEAAHMVNMEWPDAVNSAIRDFLCNGGKG